VSEYTFYVVATDGGRDIVRTSSAKVTILVSSTMPTITRPVRFESFLHKRWSFYFVNLARNWLLLEHFKECIVIMRVMAKCQSIVASKEWRT
jgi:hypothetical protein